MYNTADHYDDIKDYWMYACTRWCVGVHMYTCMCMCVQSCVCAYVCVCVYIKIYLLSNMIFIF